MSGIVATGVGVAARVVNAVTSGALAATRAAALACGLFLAPPVSSAIDTITSMVTPLVPAKIGNLSLMSPARSQPAALTKSPSDTLSAYDKAVSDFKSILRERRAQIDSNQPLPN